MSLACDIVLAAESAFFIFPFAPLLVLLPDGGSTWHLARRLGPARAMSLALTGARLPCAEAAATGLIAGVQPDNNLLQHACSVAIAASAAPQHMVQELLDAFDAALSQDLAGQLEYERQKQKIMLDFDAFAEGTLAFLEKREPDFRVLTTTCKHACRKCWESAIRLFKAGCNGSGWPNRLRQCPMQAGLEG